ncbi:hypothetical protein SAMN04487928_108116 [Butyrivibrio proteoclasticus]|uniref:Uncharacterized protein n=1 Tax=Butyrivibrio proteoclasticus TaxID=43305 RepID=A0A1I5TBF4_9FIRM|nr:hypothetical protein [Butyrivibrio proteoclasticus]SFP80384.1 hypothetical protein SAMN04487928_108116 [Butyrivibrio proteoclasticus]
MYYNYLMELILYLISFITSAFPTLFLSAPPVEDALGTMGAAAYIAGYDWSAFLAADGFFYKYGMSILYLPAFLFIKNPLLRYKLLLVENSVLDAFIPVLIYKVSHKHFSFGKEISFYLSVICGMMPSVLLYTKYTWAEPALFLIPWITIYLLFELKSIKDTPEKKKILSFALGFVCVSAFICHQRGIILVLATIMTLILIRVSAGKSLILKVPFCVSFVASLLTDRFCNYLLREYVYLGVKPAHNLLDAFLSPQLYKELFSFLGQQVFWMSFSGWMMNVCVSGLGITMLGLITGISCINRFLFFKDVNVVSDIHLNDRKKELFSILSLWSILSFCGAFLLGLLFFFQTAVQYWNGTAVERCDHLVFGRYLESMYPVLMFMGLYYMYMNRKKLLSGVKLFSIAAYVFFSVFFSLKIAPAMEGVDSYVHSLMSMNYCFDTSNIMTTQDVITNLPHALIVACVISFIIFITILILSHSGNYRLCTFVILCCFLYIYAVSYCGIIYKVDFFGVTKYAIYYLKNG